MDAVLEMILGIFIVFLAALIFVNALEYIGYRFRLGGSFVGAILAPVFTSFPEMTVFIVAVFFSRVETGEAIGVGTLFGQPFMASSLSYGLVGLSALVGFHLKRRDHLTLEVDRSLLVPYIFITFLFPATLLPAVLGCCNYIFGTLFLAAFLFYMLMMYQRRGTDIIEDAEMPYFHRLLPHPFSPFIQLIIAVILLYYGSKSLIGGVDTVSEYLNISPFGLALIIVPAATAIPETASALVWGYRGRDTLSLGSLVGEKILYSTFYPGIGLFLTSWEIDIHAYMSVFVTTIVSLILLYFINRERIPWYGLCTGIIFFVGYAILIFVYGI
ncbi:MAG TPA: sodium:calcium antiporter [Archaeoglobaceae archaeon]|nr:sodium:calcium antiporter [Archaeoglobaceae archaeon]